MGLALLQDAFAIVRATPISGPALSSDDVENIKAQFSDLVAATRRKNKLWRNNIEKLASEIPIASRAYIIEYGDSDEIISDLEKLRSEIIDRIEKVSLIEKNARRVADEAHREARLFFGSNAEKYVDYSYDMQYFIREDVEISSDFLEFLTVLIAEIDPQARGGPSFEKADDLIAYLNR